MNNGEGFAYFNWHRMNALKYPEGSCAYPYLNGWCLSYWASGAR